MANDPIKLITVPTLDEFKTKMENEIPDSVQYSTMPTASSDWVGKIVQYTGSATASYTNGFFYKCVPGSTSGTYQWVSVDVQSGGGGGGGDATRQINQYVIDPIDLAEAYASEIATAGNIWTWLHTRILDNDLTGINLGDYFKFTLPEVQGHTNVEFTARIHCIYYDDEGNLVVDFICDELLPEPMMWNYFSNGFVYGCNCGYKKWYQYYNGSEWITIIYVDLEYSYMTSKIYHYLNGIRGYEPTYATRQGSTTTWRFSFTEVTDYEDNGLAQLLPQEMLSVLVDKKSYASCKYLEDKTLSVQGQSKTTYTYPDYDTSKSSYVLSQTMVINYGKLWIPTIYDLTQVTGWADGLDKTTSTSYAYSAAEQLHRLSQYNYKRLSYIKPNSLELKFPEGVDESVDNYYWTATAGFSLNIEKICRKAETEAYTVESGKSNENAYIPLCFTIG